MPGQADKRLGKLPYRFDRRTLLAAKYMRGLPAPPPRADWGSQVPTWPLFGNNAVGDCTCAAQGHRIIGQVTADGGAAPPLTDSDVLAAYSAVSGYDPSTGANDNGAVELDVLKYMQSTGIAGDKIGAFALVNCRMPLQLQQAIYLFGGVYVGAELPVAAEAQFDANQPWDVRQFCLTGDLKPGSWGGHAMWVWAYDQTLGIYRATTWGRAVTMTARWVRAYWSEAWGIVAQDWLGADDRCPSGFDRATLLADLQVAQAEAA